MEEKGRIGEAKENMDGNGGMEEFEGGRAQKVVCRGRFKPKKFFYKSERLLLCNYCF